MADLPKLEYALKPKDNRARRTRLLLAALAITSLLLGLCLPFSFGEEMLSACGVGFFEAEETGYVLGYAIPMLLFAIGGTAAVLLGTVGRWRITGLSLLLPNLYGICMSTCRILSDPKFR